jgi:hypothetical protein
MITTRAMTTTAATMIQMSVSFMTALLGCVDIDLWANYSPA